MILDVTRYMNVAETSSALVTKSVAFVKDNSYWFIVGVVTLIVLAVGGYFANKYFRNKLSPKEEDEDDDGEKTCEILFFYTTWCPYCKKALPEWRKFAKLWNGKVQNGYTVITTEVDCDQSESVANKFDVNGYPTIKCVMNDKVTDFDAKPTVEALTQFVNSVL